MFAGIVACIGLNVPVPDVPSFVCFPAQPRAGMASKTLDDDDCTVCTDECWCSVVMGSWERPAWNVCSPEVTTWLWSTEVIGTGTRRPAFYLMYERSAVIATTAFSHATNLSLSFTTSVCLCHIGPIY